MQQSESQAPQCAAHWCGWRWRSRPWRWRRRPPRHSGKKLSYTMIDLGTLPGMTMTMSSFGGINQRGQVTGWSYFNHYADDSPFLWEKGVMIGLDTPTTVCGPQDINDHSQIVGPYIDAGHASRLFLRRGWVCAAARSGGGPGGRMGQMHQQPRHNWRIGQVDGIRLLVRVCPRHLGRRPAAGAPGA